MSDALWTFDAFVEATDGRPVGAAPSGLNGISIDSRTIAPGDAFFAIRGDRFDGHDFVAGALARGAAAAVIDADKLAAIGAAKGPLVVVGDVMDALRGLASAARKRSRAGIVAVTGSVGKTSTKEMLATALGADAPTHYSPASFNNHWGVPLTLARLPEDDRFAVFEIGMNHAGEIEPLVAMVRPQVAIVTNVEPVHLAYFNSVEDIARAKAEIFTGVEPGGAALLNRDNAHFELLSRLAVDAGVRRVISFGEDDDSDIALKSLALHANCSCVTARVFGEDVSYKLGAPGRHLVHNSLAVLGAVSLLGGDLAKAMLALADLNPPAGRGRRHRLAVRGDAFTVIDESYNANPASMAAAIALLGQFEPDKGGRRVAVLGDMLELGDGTDAAHRSLSDMLDEAGVDVVFAAGPNMKALWDVLPRHRQGGYAVTAAELESALFADIRPGDVVMVKGSNASRLGPVVAAMLKNFGEAATTAGRREQETA